MQDTPRLRQRFDWTFEKSDSPPKVYVSIQCVVGC